MDLKLFQFYLPPEQIAQAPTDKRDESKLFLLDRNTNKKEHLHFKDIINKIPKDACLVINETKVVSARLIGKKRDTGAIIEALYLSHNHDEVTCLVKPSRRVSENTIIDFDGDLFFTAISKKEEGIVIFRANLKDDELITKIENIGKIPLPPYIRNNTVDKNRYQTVYANKLGSSAAPTAGLHFTTEILETLEKRGVEIIKVCLKIGLGTFRPIKENNILNHKMHYETYEITKSAATRLNNALANNKKIIAVGTTVARTLESNYLQFNKIVPGTYNTNLFIYPGFKFNVVNHLITNFHLPGSSLLILVSAFYNREKIIEAYNEAVSLKYRFFSFGDAMFII